MNIEQTTPIDKVSLYKYKHEDIVKKGIIKCQKCKSIYDDKSDIAQLTCGYTCHITCLQNTMSAVIL